MDKVTPIRRGVKRGPIERNQKRGDGWHNLVTLLGTSADKRTASRLTWDWHDPEFFEQMYAGGGIPARIVDLIPEEALRHWVDWVGVDKKIGEQINDRCEQLDVRGALLRSWKWGRAYGGAVCHIVTDTDDPASPLRIGERVLGLRDLSRWDLRILTTDIEFDFGSPNWGHPRIYYLNVQMGSQYKGYPIHWTRMIRFDGQLVPRRTYIRNNYWHDSILNRLYNSIRNYETANDSAAACLQDFNVDVFKMKNLANLIATGNEAVVQQRIEILEYAKSVLNAMIIDADEEDYENKGRTLTGVAELLVHQANRLVAETDIPHTKLLGESPDGSQATGNSTSQQWYNFIATEQENYLRLKMKRLLQVLFPEMPELGFKFKSLRVLDDGEKADLRLKVAQTDQIYMDSGVLDPSEVTESRFGGDEWSMETGIDVAGREAGIVVPGQQETEEPEEGGSGGEGEEGPQGFEAKESAEREHDDSETFHIAGDQPPEGESEIEAEPPPSEPEPGQDMRGHEGEGRDITGTPAELHPAPHDGVEGQGIGELFSGLNRPGTEFEPRNEELKVGPPSRPNEKTFISQTMSEPMRDPRTDPHIKGPGIPNRNRTVLPTRGTGIMAPSGFDFEKDAGKTGAPREMPPEAASGGSYYAYDGFTESAHPRAENGQFGSGAGASHVQTHKGHKIEVKPNAKGGYSAHVNGKEMPGNFMGHGTAIQRAQHLIEKGRMNQDKLEPEDKGPYVAPEARTFSEPSRRRAATIIVRKGDHFLMGKTNLDGRWTLPGGLVEDKESMHQGGVRELAEETGIESKRLKFLGSRRVESQMGQPTEVAIYEHKVDEDVRPTAKKDPDKEVSKWEWVHSKEPLHQDILGNLKHPNNVALDHMGLLK